MNRSELYESIGWRMAEVRANRQIPLTDAAEKLHISARQLRKFESGACVPVWVLVALAEHYDCTLDDLVPVVS